MWYNKVYQLKGENTMKKFLCIIRVNSVAYAVMTTADTAYQAEHRFLDMGVIGRSEYGCEACTAFDMEAPQALTWALFTAEQTISEKEAYGLIAENNLRILRAEGR